MKKIHLYTLAKLGRINKAPQHDTVEGVACDSRLVREGQLFVALPGNKTDGHQYLEEVAQKGAKAALVHIDYKGPSYGMDLIHVPNVLDTLQTLARDCLKELRCRIVGITGSIGKTTTKEFLHQILSGRYRSFYTPGNANSQIGLPLAILNGIKGDEEIVICEMGMTEPGNIARLVKIAPPDLAIITGVELVHAVNFENIEAIARAKSEIFSDPSTQLGLINRALPNWECLSSAMHQHIFTFSHTNTIADFQFALNEDGSLIIGSQAKTAAKFPPLELPGKHNGLNYLIAACAAYLLGMSWQEIAERQPHLQLPEKRLQFVEKNGILFINDSYNAAVPSVKAALESIPETKGRRIAALGEMLELGKYSENCHEEVGRHALNYVDELFCFGDGCKPIVKLWQDQNKPCHLFENHSDLIASLREKANAGDVVLVKGSRGKQMWKVVEEF